MLPFSEIQRLVIDKLQKGLAPTLTYHNVSHTLDVLRQATEIAARESFVNEEDLLLLKVGALYHDVGFLNTYAGHEEKSCLIASAELAGFGFTKEQIEKICGMIRATKVPQNPQTLLEEIICDSDLDYLGRDDFFSIGEGLYKEFSIQKIVSNEEEWNQLQVSFLESHRYFTKTSNERRKKGKQLNLEKIKEKINLTASIQPS